MNVIILGCHRGLTRGVIKSLINSKVKFSFIGTKELIKSVSLSKLCKSFYEIEEKDFDIGNQRINGVIKSIINGSEDNFVIPTGIRSTLYVSKHAMEIKGNKNLFPISDYNILSMLNNKWDFYLFLEKNNLLTPKTILLNSLEEQQNITKKLQFPVITKPLDSENSMNVIRSDNLTELDKVANGSTLPLLVQEYIPGHDINLCIYSLNGTIKAWTINKRTEKGIVFENNKEMLRIGEEIVKKLNFSGLIHFDFRLNEQDGKIMIIECNPRVWASMLHSAYVGVNFMELAINNQSIGIRFNEIKSGTISLNLNSLIKKFLKPSISWQDFKSIYIQTKLFMHDPLYEVSFFIYNR